MTRGRVATLVAALVLLSAATRFVDAFDLARFGVALVLFVVVPGVAFVRHVDRDLAQLERWALALVLGTLVATLWYALTALANARPAFVALPVLGAVLWWRSPAPASSRPAGDTGVWLVFAALVAAIAPLAFVPYYSNNLDLHPGRQAVHAEFADATLHLALTNELTHSVPPQVPFLAGHRMSYHWGGDVPGAMFVDWAGVSTPDVVLRLMPALFLAMLVLAASALGARWTGSTVGGAFFGFLVVFAEDLSWLAAVIARDGQLPDSWSAVYFQTPTMYSFYSVNPMVLGVAALFTALVCLDGVLRKGGYGWWAAFGLAAAGAWEYKVFVGALLAGALVLCGTVEWFARRTRTLAVAGVVAAAVGLPIVAYSSAGAAGSERLLVRPQLPAQIADALARSRILPQDALDAVVRLFDHHVSATGVLVLVAIGVPFFVVGALGARLVGVAQSVARPLRADVRVTSAVARTVSVIVVAGLAATLVVRIELGIAYNNSSWFAVTAKHLLWLPVVGTTTYLARRRPLMAAVVAAAVVAVSLPAAVEFFAFVRRADRDRLSAAQTASVRTAAKACRPGDVAIAPDPLDAVLVSVSTCRTIGLDVYGTSFVSAQELKRRTSDVDEFWRRWRRGECPEQVLRRYDVRVVLAPASETSEAPCRSPEIRVLKASERFVVLRVDVV